MAAAPLKRARRTKNTRDSTGTVRIQIMLVAPGTGAHLKGNIVRAFHVSRTKVSDVAARIGNLIGNNA